MQRRTLIAISAWAISAIPLTALAQAVHSPGKSNASNYGNADQGNQGNSVNDVSSNAAPPSRRAEEPEQEFALRAVETGDAKPLAEVIKAAKEIDPAAILDARLIEIRGFLLYEIKVFKGNSVKRLYFYAASGLPVQER